MASMRVLKWVLIIMLLLFSLLHGQEREKKFRIDRVETPPKIDGHIDDPCWNAIEPVSGFFQYDPVNGVPASEPTWAWMAYDSQNLYFAFQMQDSEPKKIWAELTPRNEYESNDSIAVILDTYNDKRTSVSFTVNPKNVQKNSLETIWCSGAQVTAAGWTAEIAIPWKSLRFSPALDQVWGVNFQRYIQRLNETDYWTSVNRDRPLLQQMGEIAGLSGVTPGHNSEFFPYIGFRSSRWEEENNQKLAAGLDFKYGISSNLILDMTASPDFSQVESDPFIYQFSPYENYLQEMRPFFSEGSQYFDLATEGGYEYEEPSYRLFYSRRIGSPKFAGKLSGKAGGFAFGVLGAWNKEGNGNSGFSVVRVQKDIMKNSQIGIYYTGLDESVNHNHNFAVDYNFNLKDVYYIRGASILTFNSGQPARGNGLHFLQMEREVDAGFNWDFNFSRIEKNAAIQTGFITRTDVQSAMFDLAYGWRFNRGQFKHFQFSLEGNLEQNCDWDTTGRSLTAGAELELASMMMVDFRLSAGQSRYQVENQGENLHWTKDSINTAVADLEVMWFRGGVVKEFRLDFEWERRGIYTDNFSAVAPGRQVGIEGEVVLRPRSNFEVGLGWQWTRQTLAASREKVFQGATYDLSLHYQFTPNLFMAGNLKGETREAQYNLDVLLGYYFGAGNIVQLVYKKSARKEERLSQSGDSITLKISYLLRM